MKNYASKPHRLLVVSHGKADLGERSSLFCFISFRAGNLMSKDKLTSERLKVYEGDESKLAPTLGLIQKAISQRWEIFESKVMFLI